MIHTRLDGLDLKKEKWIDMLGPVLKSIIVVSVVLPAYPLMRHVKMIILCTFISIFGNGLSANANTHLYIPGIWFVPM